MGFSYSGNPSSSEKDQVRFYIGDTNKKRPLFDDREITFLITSEGGPLQAAISGCLQLAAKFARQCDEEVGKISKDYSQRSTAYFKLSEELKKKLARTGSIIPFAGGISKQDKSNRELNPDRVEPLFTKDLHNNDQAGSE